MCAVSLQQCWFVFAIPILNAYVKWTDLEMSEMQANIPSIAVSVFFFA